MDEDKRIVLMEPANAAEGQFLVSILRDEGIAAQIEQNNLADEFATSQDLLGSGRVRLYVFARDRDRAVALLADAAEGEREPLPEGPDEPVVGTTHDDDTRAGGSPWPAFWALTFAAAALIFGLLWWQERSMRLAGRGEDPVLRWGYEDDRYVVRRMNGGSRHSVSYDINGDGYAEETEFYGVNDQLLALYVDHNQDGNSESFWSFHAGGSRDDWSSVVFDRDENGFADELYYPVVDGRYWRWLDEDQDGYWEARELVNEETGEVVMRHEDMREEGFRKVK